MGMFTDYFVATPERAMTLADEGPGGHDVPKLEMKWVEPGVLGSTLWAIIEDAPVPEGMRLPFDLERFSADGESLFVSAEYTHGLTRISDGFVRALAALPDERIAPVAARWAMAEEWGVEWLPGELDDTVRGLRDLAREVRFPEQHMYVWMCM